MPGGSSAGGGVGGGEMIRGTVAGDGLHWCRCCGERRMNCVLLADAFRPEAFDQRFVHCDHICPLCHKFIGNLMCKILTKSTHDKVLRYWLANEQISLPKTHVFVKERMQSIMDSTSSDHLRKAQNFIPYVPGLVVEYLSERWSDPTTSNNESSATSSSSLTSSAKKSNKKFGKINSGPSSSGAGATSGIKDISDTGDAVILMADVTGYTALAETFCEQRGVNAGVEAVVTNCLNKYFTKLVETIYEYGGDVVKFAGDAVLCVWKPQVPKTKRMASSATFAKQQRQQILENYAQAAMLCAFKAKGLVERVQVGNDEKVLKLHCGLACGKVSIISVGGSEPGMKREILVTGETLRRAGEAVDYASAESVVIDYSVWRLVRTITICSQVEQNPGNSKVLKFFGEDAAPKIGPKGSGGFWLVKEVTVPLQLDKSHAQNSGLNNPSAAMSHKLPPVELLLGVLESYIPAHVVKQMKTRQRIYNDVRLVSTLFMNISNDRKNIGYETSQAQLELLQEIFSLAQRIVNHHEGMVRQFIVDDKGCVLIVCFGVSTYRHKDDASRAIATAIDLQQALGSIGDETGSKIKTSIGVTTGRAFCGPIGSSRSDEFLDKDHDIIERREYSVVGNCVNLAARLMNVAYQRGEGILCDEATMENVRLSMGQHRRGPIFALVDSVNVKGIREKVNIYKPDKADGNNNNNNNGGGSDLITSNSRKFTTPQKQNPQKASNMIYDENHQLIAQNSTGMDSSSMSQNNRNNNSTRYRSLSSSSSAGRPSLLVAEDNVCFGRNQEKTFISHRLFAFTKGVLDPCILIQGEEGMGKSNLLNWVRQEIQTNFIYSSIKVMGGSCQRSGSRISYYGRNNSQSARRHTIANDGLRGFFCELFNLPCKDIEEDQSILAQLIQNLQDLVKNSTNDQFGLFNSTNNNFRPFSTRQQHQIIGNDGGIANIDLYDDDGECQANFRERKGSDDSIDSLGPINAHHGRICSVNLTAALDGMFSENSRRKSLPTSNKTSHQTSGEPSCDTDKMFNPLAQLDEDGLLNGAEITRPGRAYSQEAISQPVHIINKNSNITKSASKPSKPSTNSITNHPNLNNKSHHSFFTSSEDDEDDDDYDELDDPFFKMRSRRRQSDQLDGSGKSFYGSSIVRRRRSSVPKSTSMMLNLQGNNPNNNSNASISASPAAVASNSSIVNNNTPKGKENGPKESSGTTNSGSGSTISKLRAGFNRRLSVDLTKRSSSKNLSQPAPIHVPTASSALKKFKSSSKLRSSKKLRSGGAAATATSTNTIVVSSVKDAATTDEEDPFLSNSDDDDDDLDDLDHDDGHDGLEEELLLPNDEESSEASSVIEDGDTLMQGLGEYEISNQRLLNQQTLQFRYTYPLISSKVDETTIRVFLSSNATDLAQCIVHMLASSNPTNTKHDSMRLDSAFDEELSSNKNLSSTDALVAEVLCLVVMLSLKQRKDKICVTIDDLEWLDSLSMMILRNIIGPQCPGVMVIATTRTSAVDRVQNRLGFKLNASPFIYPFELLPLSEDEIRELLVHTFEIPTWPSDIIKRVLTSCNGLPLWAIEYVRGMIANKFIKRNENNEWIFDEDKASMELVFSAGLEGAILQRFDNLKEEIWKHAFIWACVVETDFSVTMLRDLLIYSETQDKLEELVKRRHIKMVPGLRNEQDEQYYTITDDVNIIHLGEDLQTLMQYARGLRSSKFTLRDLVNEKINHTDKGKYQQIVDELERERFVVPGFNNSIFGGEPMYHVAHDYYYHAVYNQIPPGELGRYHLQTAQCLSSYENEFIDPLLAHHYHKAGDENNTVRCLFRGAKSHYKHDHIHQACGFLIEAVRLGDGNPTVDTEDFAKMKLMLSQMLLYLGRHTDAELYLGQVEELLGMSASSQLDQADQVVDPQSGHVSGATPPRPVRGGSAGSDATSSPDMPPIPPASTGSGPSSSLRRLYRFSSATALPYVGGSRKERGSSKSRRTTFSTSSLPLFSLGSSSSNNNDQQQQQQDQPKKEKPVRRSSFMSSMLPDQRFGKPRSSSTPTVFETFFSSPSSTTSTSRRPRAQSAKDSADESDGSATIGVDISPSVADDMDYNDRSSRSSRQRRPSLRRMCSSSMFPKLFGQKNNPAKDISFIAHNMDWIRAHAMLLSMSFFSLDHDTFIYRLKMLIAGMLENGLNKESGFIQFLVFIAHCVSPKYSKIKPSFTLKMVDSMINEATSLEGIDHGFFSGILYEICAMCSISKASYTVARSYLDKAYASFRRSSLLKHNMHRKHHVEVLIMSADVAMQRGLLLQAEKLCSEAADNYGRVLQSPQVFVWTEAYSALIHFKRFGILLTLKEITSYEENAAAAAAAKAVAAAAVAAAPPSDLPKDKDGKSNSKEQHQQQQQQQQLHIGIGSKPQTQQQQHQQQQHAMHDFSPNIVRSGLLTRPSSMSNMMPSNILRDTFLGEMEIQSVGDGGMNIDDHADRLMAVDRALWAALRSWKCGDQNNPAVNKADAIQYATIAWNILLENGQQFVVWYLGLVYEILFYAITQIVQFSAPPKPNTKRYGMSFTTESLKLLCKSFKLFAETFLGSKPIAHRLKGILCLLLDKPAKAMTCFRKAHKVAHKLGMDYEQRFAMFLVQQYCLDSDENVIFTGFGIPRSFSSAFDLTMRTWKTSQPAMEQDLLLILSTHSEGMSPSRRSLSGGNGSAFPALDSLDSGYHPSSRLKRRSSSNRDRSSGGSANSSQRNSQNLDLPPTYATPQKKVNSHNFSTDGSPDRGPIENVQHQPSTTQVKHFSVPIGSGTPKPITRRSSETATTLHHKYGSNNNNNTMIGNNDNGVVTPTKHSFSDGDAFNNLFKSQQQQQQQHKQQPLL